MRKVLFLNLLLHSGLRVSKIVYAIASWELARDILHAAAGHGPPAGDAPGLSTLVDELSEAKQPFLYLDQYVEPGGKSFLYGDLLEAYLAQLSGRQPSPGDWQRKVVALRYISGRRNELAAVNDELANFAVGRMELICGSSSE